MRTGIFIQVLTVLVSVMVIGLIVSTIISKKDVRGVESNVLFTVESIADDNDLLYRDIFEMPYSITQYSPLYYMLSDALNTNLGFSKNENTYGLRIALRAMSFICFLLILFFSLRCIKAFDKGSLNKLKKLLLVLGMTALTCPWFFLTRPDVLVSLFFVLCLYTFLKSRDGLSLKYTLLLGLFSFLAIASKQNGILVIPVVVLSFFYFKNFKAIGIYFSSILISFLGFYLIYSSLGYSIDHVITNLVVGVSNGLALREAVLFAIVPFLFIFGLPFILIFKRSIAEKTRILKDPKLFFLVLFTLANFGFACLTSVKYGSAVNYFNDTIIFSLILAFVLIKQMTPSVLKMAFVYCFLVAAYQFLSYFPGIVNDLRNEEHYGMLEELSQSIEEEIKEGEMLFTDIRPLALDLYEHAVFMPYEVYTASSFLDHSYRMQYFKTISIAQAQNIEWVVLHKESLLFNVWKKQYELIQEQDGVKIFRMKK